MKKLKFKGPRRGAGGQKVFAFRNPSGEQIVLEVGKTYDVPRKAEPGKLHPSLAEALVKQGAAEYVGGAVAPAPVVAAEPVSAEPVSEEKPKKK